MLQLLISFFMFSGIVFAQGSLEGKTALITFTLKGLVQSNTTLTANAEFKNATYSSGLFFEPVNKEMKIDIPKTCQNLAEIAFAQNLKLTIKGDVKKHEEFLASPSLIQFLDKVVKCEVAR